MWGQLNNAAGEDVGVARIFPNPHLPIIQGTPPMPLKTQ
jgi:hypothetical protein